MTTAQQLISRLESGAFDPALAKLYSADLSAKRARLVNAVDGFERQFGEQGPLRLFSVPGRSEISGNHTDHNHGRVLAAAIDLDVIAVAAKTGGGAVRVKSEGFEPDEVALGDIAPRPEREHRAAALLSGVCDGFVKNGYEIGGFTAYTTSEVLSGSGLSSSAAYEDMLGTILSEFYNNGSIPPVKLAQISQYAENVHYGKPCGLMDQCACAVGGFVAIDFADPASPVVEPIDFDMSAPDHAYSLCIVAGGGSHAGLDGEYASIPQDMRAVAGFFGKKFMRELSIDEVLNNIQQLRQAAGDRAVLRAVHFLDENERVLRQTQALRRGDFGAFLDGVRDSGDSSYKLLQNIYTAADPRRQEMAVALMLCDRFTRQHGGACRIHGGGFAGTVQAFVPQAEAARFRAYIDTALGEGSCMALHVRQAGAVAINN